MRQARTILLGAIACLVAPNMASSTTSSELLRSCLDILSGVGPKTEDEVDIPQSGLTCWYYMSAIQNMSVLETPRGVRLLGICAPPQTMLMDYVRIFVAQARKRNARSDNAAALAVVILSEVFPCRTSTRSH
jgi:Ssp1 endopeptidase immunity protein Rap1a